jgi:hypothetical protein
VDRPAAIGPLRAVWRIYYQARALRAVLSREIPAPRHFLSGSFRSGDNNDVYIARALAHQAQFLAAIAQVALPPQVVSITPTLGTDWDGESAVFFQVILADNSVPRTQLLAFTKQISQAIIQQIRPLEEWGVLPYFNFITQSEQARMKEPTWA